jgi:hypothetical protein
MNHIVGFVFSYDKFVLVMKNIYVKAKPTTQTPNKVHSQIKTLHILLKTSLGTVFISRTAERQRKWETKHKNSI